MMDVFFFVVGIAAGWLGFTYGGWRGVLVAIVVLIGLLALKSGVGQ